MLISRKHKIVVFLVPRTGTVTLFNLCKNQGLDVCAHAHNDFDFFMNSFGCKLTPEEVLEFRCFGFYRDPLERAISLARHLKRKHWLSFLYYFYGKSIQLSCLDTTPYEEIDSELKVMIENISIGEMFSCNFVHDISPTKPQTYWLDHPFMNLLNFHDYENQVKWLLNEMEITVDSIPQLNQGIKREDLDSLTDQDIINIKKIYKSDYDFLASRGIYF